MSSLCNAIELVAFAAFAATVVDSSLSFLGGRTPAAVRVDAFCKLYWCAFGLEKTRCRIASLHDAHLIGIAEYFLRKSFISNEKLKFRNLFCAVFPTLHNATRIGRIDHIDRIYCCSNLVRVEETARAIFTVVEFKG